MIYLIVAIVVIVAFVFWFTTKKPGKPRKKKNGFQPDFSGMRFSDQKCGCI